MTAQRATRLAFQDYLRRLKEDGYDISLQGSEHGALNVVNGHIQALRVASLPSEVINAAVKAGAKDNRLSICHLVRALDEYAANPLPPIKNIQSIRSLNTSIEAVLEADDKPHSPQPLH